MKVTLVGPDDLGYWFLHTEDGGCFPLVQRRSDHVAAASLFGWTERNASDEYDVIEDARLWLMEHIGDEIEAPLPVADYFQKLQAEEDD